MKIGRNQPCPCGSGKKHKKCCLNKPVKKLSEQEIQLEALRKILELKSESMLMPIGIGKSVRT